LRQHHPGTGDGLIGDHYLAKTEADAYPWFNIII
jgi:hypothetical protein